MLPCVGAFLRKVFRKWHTLRNICYFYSPNSSQYENCMYYYNLQADKFERKMSKSINRLKRYGNGFPHLVWRFISERHGKHNQWPCVQRRVI